MNDSIFIPKNCLIISFCYQNSKWCVYGWTGLYDAKLIGEFETDVDAMKIACSFYTHNVPVIRGDSDRVRKVLMKLVLK